MKAEARGMNPPTISPLQNPSGLFTNSRGSISGALTGCLSSLDGACIEKLLLHCGSALESNDVTLAQQVMWVLNNVASSTGDPNQRLASYFLRALISRASRVCPTTMSFKPAAPHRRLMSVTELAGYVDLLPWHRFGFCAANSAILEAVRGFPSVHILDLSITHCMQWPTFIDALGKVPGGPPAALRISVPSWRPPAPPLLNASIEEVGQRLVNFAKFRDVPFEFNVVDLGGEEEEEESAYDSLLSQLNAFAVKVNADEALVVNVQNWLRYLPDDESRIMSIRDSFLESIGRLNPRLVTVVDEDCDLGGGLASRIAACFNYMWIPFDALETFLPKESPQRIEYESDIGHKIENIVGFEGAPRVERPESGSRLCHRMAGAGFTSVPLGEETVKEVKALLDEHASGWGMKKDEEDMLVLTWKGHNAVYAAAWAPRANQHPLAD
ncbi:scarecrow-like protein 32 [Salvia miltiorrhiza]|uniref:scarecrow-like protein 32 n=1 Tax=Salvia miltiorrhiza TaxID=226208 RepID=UPI0025ACEB5A|nr:scarecrow-like protein 32 [Salvia miltiorrhiza]